PRPHFRRHTIEHRTKWHRHCLRLLPYFLRSPRPGPGQSFRVFFHSAKTRAAQHRGKTSWLRETKRIWTTRRQQRSTNMTMDNAHRTLPVRLLERSPRQKTSACTSNQNAMQFPQRTLCVLKKHHSKAAGRQIEAVVIEGQRLCVGLSREEIVETSLPCSFLRNLKQVGAQIESRNPSLRSNEHSQTDRWLACSTSQIQNPHPRLRLRIFHQGRRHALPHHRRFRLPFLGGNQAIGSSPSLFFGTVRFGGTRHSDTRGGQLGPKEKSLRLLTTRDGRRRSLRRHYLGLHSRFPLRFRFQFRGLQPFRRL